MQAQPTEQRMTETSRFDSFDAFVEQAISSKDKWAASRTGSEDFTGTKTFDDAVTLARNGWPDGTKKILALRASMDGAVRSLVNARASTYSYDMSGEFVDVGRFLSGEPECFGIEVQDFGNISAPIVKIVANIGASGCVSTDALFMRGASIVAAIDILESLGRRVEVWMAKGSKHYSKKQHEIYVMLKQANQPLNIDRVAFAIAHPATLRRFCFSVMEQNGFDSSSVHSYTVSMDNAIVTAASFRESGKNMSPKECLEMASKICEQAGISIPKSELEALKFSAR